METQSVWEIHAITTYYLEVSLFAADLVTLFIYKFST